MKTRRNHICLIIIIVVQLLVMVWATFGKKGYFVDELWEFGIANSYYSPHIFSTDIYERDEYVTPQFFMDYLTVDENDDFCYDSVFSNAGNDAHPPFYACLIHTISSIFKRHVNKWMGIIPNYLFFAVSAIILYLIGCKILQDRWIALAPVVMWGFSTQTISYVILIRMYMVVCMWMLLSVYLHADVLQDNKPWTKKGLIALFCANYFAFLTQLYTLVFAFFFTGFTCIVLMMRREWKQMFQYAGTVLLAVVAGFATFPGVLNSFTGENAFGASVAGQMFEIHGFIQREIDYLRLVKDKMAYGINSKYMHIIAVFFVVAVIQWIVKTRGLTFSNKLKQVNVYPIIIIFVCTIHFAIIARVSPFVSDRYVQLVTPYVWLIGVYYTSKVCCNRIVIKYVLNSILLVVTITSFFFGIRGGGKIMFQYPQEALMQEELDNHPHSSAVYVVNQRQYTATVEMVEFLNYDEILLADVGYQPFEQYRLHDETDNMYLYVDDMLDYNNLINIVSQKTRYNQFNLVYRGCGIGWDNNQEFYVIRCSVNE